MVELICGAPWSMVPEAAAAVLFARGAAAAMRWTAALELASTSVGRTEPAASAMVTASAGRLAEGASAAARALAILAGSLGAADIPGSMACTASGRRAAETAVAAELIPGSSVSKFCCRLSPTAPPVALLTATAAGWADGNCDVVITGAADEL
jgi:hypothetical protein